MQDGLLDCYTAPELCPPFVPFVSIAHSVASPTGSYLPCFLGDLISSETTTGGVYVPCVYSHAR